MAAGTPPVPSVPSWGHPAPSHQDDFDDEVFLVGTLQAVVFCKAEEGGSGWGSGGPSTQPCREHPWVPPPRTHVVQPIRNLLVNLVAGSDDDGQDDFGEETDDPGQLLDAQHKLLQGWGWGQGQHGGGWKPGAGRMRTHLELEAAQHEEEDEGEAGEADGEADQALEEQALPWWVVKLLRAGHRADSLNALMGAGVGGWGGVGHGSV